MSSRRGIPMRALLSGPVHSPANPRARVIIALVAVVAAFLFAFARADSASASDFCLPASDLVAIDPAHASCFEGFDGNQTVTPADSALNHFDWQDIVANQG